MLNFRQDMIELSKKYPGILKVVVTKDYWESMCDSFDKQLGNPVGHTLNHIKDKNGSMKFEDLFVEETNEK